MVNISNLSPSPVVNLSVSSTTGTETGTTIITVTATASSAVSGDQTVNLGVSGTGITASDYYLSKNTITIANGQTSGSVSFIVADDAIVEGTETATLTISTPSAGISLGATTSQNITITNNDSSFLTKVGGITSASGAEISAFDPVSKRLFVVAGNTVDIYTVSSTGSLTVTGTLTPTITPTADTTLIPNSVTVKNGVVAVAYAVQNTTTSAQLTGKVAFFNAGNGSLINAVDVGALPDMLTFTPDGTKVLVANEGEPNSYGQTNSVDPEGSVSIINIAGGVASATVQTATFTSFNSQIASLKASGVRIIGPGATVAQDLEPEFIAVAPDGLTARITLQENNAIAILDIATATITQIIPLGAKDYSLPGNGIDPSDQDGGINIRNVPVFGLYQPDAIASFSINGQTYYITANEGDSRAYTGFNEEIRVSSSSYGLDTTVFPNATTLKQNTNLGRLQVTNATGNTDADAEFERIESFGARSFSIWNSNGTQVFDSGDQLEQITAAKTPTLFNSDGTITSFDQRSDNKGPEPEGVVVGVINGRTYAFIGLERTGDIVVYDVSNPNQPIFVQYINTPEDIAVEGLTFISAADSPTGKPLLVTANEVSKTVAVFEVNVPVFNFSTANYSVTEGNTTGFNTYATVKITRTGSISGTDTVQLQLSDGTAEGGVDYINTPITVTFAPDETYKDVQIPIAGDTNVEPNETVNLTLVNPSAGSLVGTTQPNAVLTIQSYDPPTNITLSATSTNENVTPNSVIGTFSTTDPTIGDTFTYSFVAGTNDNAAFTISGNQLLINASPDFETKSSYNILVRTSDNGGLTFEKAFTINVNDLNEIVGTASNNNLVGTAGNDYIDGKAGNDTLNGGAGVDILIGGTGNDTYIVDTSTDTIIENLNEGTDNVISSVTYTLGDNLENLTLNGTTAINGTGNSLNNTITGNTANNILDGGLGTDTLIGGVGNDTYIMDSTTDTITDSVGIDTIQSSVNLSLAGYTTIENLNLTGIALNGTGNSLNNTITGNSSDNTLNGGAGNDTLVGGLGNDTLIGSAGNDSLVGGTGNDTYNFVTTTTSLGTDTITEVVGGGQDTIDFTGTTAAIRLNLSITTTQTLVANGSKLKLTAANTIENVIAGAGADRIIGNGLDNRLFGGTGNDALTSGAGNDTLVGGAGNDILTGGLGNDVFSFTGNAAFTSASQGLDTIQDFNIGNDKILLSKSVFASVTSVIGQGFSVANEFAVVEDDDLVGTSNGLIVYSSSSGSLYYNQNGAAAGFGTGGEFAILATAPSLNISNFSLI
ncbi:MAG: choice-of-anchor I family protein [Dolichospermum sp.]